MHWSAVHEPICVLEGSIKPEETREESHDPKKKERLVLPRLCLVHTYIHTYIHTYTDSLALPCK